MGRIKETQPQTRPTPESEILSYTSSAKAVKPRFGISSISEVGAVTSTSSRFLLSINLPTGLCRKPKPLWATIPTIPDEGDSIWCVFDRDDNSNEVLLRAKQSAQKEGYHLAYSNPSFELWFLLHFVNQQTEVEDCQALIRLLKQPGRLPDYEKNKDYFDVLKPLQSTAIQRAKARAEQVRNQDTELISRQSNPLTTVWELVEYLNSKI